MKVIYEFVTRGGAVIPNDVEDVESIEEAVATADTWMGQHGQRATITTLDGGGAVLKIDEIEHITVTPLFTWLARQAPEYIATINTYREGAGLDQLVADWPLAEREDQRDIERINTEREARP